MLPDIDGFAMAQKINALYPDLAFLFLTARSLKIDVLKGFSLGAVDYLKNKKIDVFDKYGRYIVSIGAKGYADYPTYMLILGKKYADERRRLYKIRHDENRRKKGTAGFFAYNILW